MKLLICVQRTLDYGSGVVGERRERMVKLTITTKTVRGRKCRDSYVKVRVPLYLVEKLGIVAYRVCLDEETGRIVLEPIYAGRGDGREEGG